MVDGWKVYEIVWAACALVIGPLAAFGTDYFIKGNVGLCRYLFDKSGLPVFKHYADNMDSASVRITARIVGGVLIVVGIKMFLQVLTAST
jgi:hypothetical protein